jgi:DNA polymerase IV
VLNSPFEGPSVDDAPILHVDLDAFFASVEVLDDPSLRGKPVAVGGAGDRGVIASASYEARKYGVKSAMPSVTARRACPNLIILPGRFDRYEEYSRLFHDIVRDLTPEFEPLGLDEVFADLRSLRRLGVRPLEAGERLRSRINDELLLRCGVGLGRNKLFAKLASKESKPQVVKGRLVDGPGVFWVSPATEKQWLASLPVRALWGVGPATAATLAAYAAGEDHREVIVDREVKSVGHDQTFARSLAGLDEVSRQLRTHAAVVARALRDRGLVARTISVTVRYDDLTSVSRSQTLPFGVDDEEAIASIAGALVASVDLSQAVRLLGLYGSSFLERADNQMQLSFGFDAGSAQLSATETSREQQVDRTALRDVVDEIRKRFGRTSLGTANELKDDGLDIAVQRGSHAFGPSSSSREP